MTNLSRENVPFTQVANVVLNDKTLSFKEKGLYAYLFSKPDGWDFAADRIALDTSESSKSIYKYLTILEEHGYLVRKRLTTGRLEYILKHSIDKKPRGTNVQETKCLGDKCSTVINTKKEIIKKKSNNKEKVKAEQSSGDTEVVVNTEKNTGVETINTLLPSFQTVNPSYAIYFSNKKQRGALERLIALHGYSRIKNIVENILPISNAQLYAPTITTPAELEVNYGKLKAFYQKQQAVKVRVGKAIL